MGLAYYQELGAFEDELAEAFCAGVKWLQEHPPSDKSLGAAAQEYVAALIKDAARNGRKE